MLGLELLPLAVRQPGDFESAFGMALSGGADALFLPISQILMPQLPLIAQFAAAQRIPSMAFQREYPDAGGLMSYGASIPVLYRRAAYYVDRILKGAKPAELPVQLPTKFEFVVNLKTARALGIDIPLKLRAFADEVIE